MTDIKASTDERFPLPDWVKDLPEINDKLIIGGRGQGKTARIIASLLKQNADLRTKLDAAEKETKFLQNKNITLSADNEKITVAFKILQEENSKLADAAIEKPPYKHEVIIERDQLQAANGELIKALQDIETPSWIGKNMHKDIIISALSQRATEAIISSPAQAYNRLKALEDVLQAARDVSNSTIIEEGSKEFYAHTMTNTINDLRNALQRLEEVGK